MPNRLCPECDTVTNGDVCPKCGTKTIAEITDATSVSDPLVGRVIEGRYRIEEVIGKGGMGTVYKAVHIAMNKVVAIKVLKAESAMDVEAIKRFHKEARAASLLSHPHTVRVFDFGQSENKDLYMVMEYLEGQSLAQLMCKEGRFSLARTMKIIGEIAQSLGEAHNAGVVHRDLKPENIYLVDVFGDPDFVKILDFGIARFQVPTLEPNITDTGLVFGTPQYMAPEQALPRTPVTPAADIYSLGIIMYEMLAGRLPFEDESPLQVMMAHLNSPVPPLPTWCQVPPELKEMLNRMLSKNPEKRPSAKEIVDFCAYMRLKASSKTTMIQESGSPKILQFNPKGITPKKIYTDITNVRVELKERQTDEPVIPSVIDERREEEDSHLEQQNNIQNAKMSINPFIFIIFAIGLISALVFVVYLSGIKHNIHHLADATGSIMETDILVGQDIKIEIEKTKEEEVFRETHETLTVKPKKKPHRIKHAPAQINKTESRQEKSRLHENLHRLFPE